MLELLTEFVKEFEKNDCTLDKYCECKNNAVICDCNGFEEEDYFEIVVPSNCKEKTVVISIYETCECIETLLYNTEEKSVEDIVKDVMTWYPGSETFIER